MEMINWNRVAQTVTEWAVFTLALGLSARFISELRQTFRIPRYVRRSINLLRHE